MQEKSRQTCEYDENSISKEERQVNQHHNAASGPEELGLIDLEKTDGSIENSLKITIDDIDYTQLDQNNRDCQKVDSRLEKQAGMYE